MPTPAPPTLPPDEVARLRALLAPVEAEAEALPWADARPWRTRTHVGWEGGLPVVDLHGLPARLARQAIRAVVEAPPPVGLVWVHGRGGTRGKRAGVLGKVVLKELGRHLAHHPGWSVDPQGPRTVWITDPERAPTAGTPVVVILVALLFALGLVVTLLRPWWDVP